nr:hypothetical protein [uncultured Sphingobacterium sp.]
MEIVKAPRVKCHRCFEKIDMEITDFEEFDAEYYSRSMGNEIHYSWACDFNCPKCNNELSVTIEGWEYPVGMLNYEEVDSENCEIIDNPQLEIDYK